MIIIIIIIIIISNNIITDTYKQAKHVPWVVIEEYVEEAELHTENKEVLVEEVIVVVVVVVVSIILCQIMC